MSENSSLTSKMQGNESKVFRIFMELLAEELQKEMELWKAQLIEIKKDMKVLELKCKEKHEEIAKLEEWHDAITVRDAMRALENSICFEAQDQETGDNAFHDNRPLLTFREWESALLDEKSEPDDIVVRNDLLPIHEELFPVNTATDPWKIKLKFML